MRHMSMRHVYPNAYSWMAGVCRLVIIFVIVMQCYLLVEHRPLYSCASMQLSGVCNLVGIWLDVTCATFAVIWGMA